MEIDKLDRQVTHALRINGRAGYREIGAVLGVSDQTVARRYRRLREEAGVRVVGLPNPIELGYETWTLRLRAAPDAALQIASALARRPDTTWVSVTSGGTEIVSGVHVPASADREALLLQKLPRTPRLVAVSAHCVIHNYVGGAVGPDLRDDALTGEQIAALTPERPTGSRAAHLTGADAPLIEALSWDGRLGYTELAAKTGWPESTVRRRVQELFGSGSLYTDVEVDPELFGFRAAVMLWLSVAPSRVASVGTALSEHEEIVFAAATTGPTNLQATAICRDMPAFYRYVTERLSLLDGVERIESAPVLKHVKQLGSVR
ncbi:Lrp/AsnC family transcriptional regulator [Actinoplanes regularis]|uniref:DNA-binding transcriptional regulator, Lrp family n=1 Tax=Actinoplanes regularis TaxID=52697 RepID=A0A239EVY3_9ACTN|nr:Lrp/AsnC family transcriptional regulator [Actinoplanes regularis]GIE89783.1 AsnC family transcriptional regulator [Actinoplanes regularis]GLW31851.1 AsnC family transcriptional regulator [Actinoplanes regularis]SNS48193.1 DNA-binding transcriptional regulator, Lrp family [Actinoplanes regularis]